MKRTAPDAFRGGNGNNDHHATAYDALLPAQRTPEDAVASVAADGAIVYR